MQKHGRSYQLGSEEFEKRKQLFEKRLKEVEVHNNRTNRLWTAGINKLSDWTEQELGRLRGWRGGTTKRDGRAARNLNLRQLKSPITKTIELPKEVSWTHLASAQDVPDQGGCGSCWAVTSSTVLDTNAEIHLGHGKGLSSAQEFVSCVPNEQHCGGDGGCTGATVELAFNWAMFNGLSPESSVPYHGVDSKCKKKVRKHHDHQLVMAAGVEVELDPPLSPQDLAAPGVHLARSHSMPGLLYGMRGWERLPANRYEPLMRAVAEHGPVAVAVAGAPWNNYILGIFDDCSKDAVIDHAVTLMGYGEDKEWQAKYWLIQNSWGSFWGENGRIRLLRKDNDEVAQCGKDKQPELGTACEGGPSEVEVCGMCGILYDSVVPYFDSQNHTAANRYF